MRPYLEKTLHKKKAGGVVQGVGPEFKPQYKKKRQKTPILQSHSNKSSMVLAQKQP
jgi:hypothetical protein